MGLTRISMPDPDSIFMTFYSFPYASLYKYALSANSFYLVNDSLPLMGSTFAKDKGELVVSSASTGNNAGRRNIYYGWDVPYHSYDGGYNFKRIGEYGGTPTHGDIRGIFLQNATNSIRGDSDRVIFATDGGVSIRKKGVDDSAAAPGTSTVDISGKGLTPGTFWSYATSERGAIGIGGAMHDGITTFEPGLSQKWENMMCVDAWNVILNNALLYHGYFFQGYAYSSGGTIDPVDLDSTKPFGSRQMGTAEYFAPPLEPDFDGIGVGGTFAADNFGALYVGKNSLFRKRLGDGDFIQQYIGIEISR
jgi:hypothetical protein